VLSRSGLVGPRLTAGTGSYGKPGHPGCAAVVFDDFGVVGGYRFHGVVESKDVAAEVYRHDDPILLCCCLWSVCGERIQSFDRVNLVLWRCFSVGHDVVQDVGPFDDVLLRALALEAAVTDIPLVRSVPHRCQAPSKSLRQGGTSASSRPQKNCLLRIVRSRR